MPSGPKKRKSAKKKKELEETLKSPPDTQDNVEGNVESITESTTDSVSTTVEQDLTVPEDVLQKDDSEDCLDSKKDIVSQDLVPDYSIAVSEEISETGIEVEIPKKVIQTEKEKEEDEVFLSENSKSEEQLESFKPTFIQEMQGIIEEMEGLKLSVIQQLQVVEKVAAALYKLVDDINNSQLIGGE